MTEHRNVEPEVVWTSADMSDSQCRYKWEEYKGLLEDRCASVTFTKVNGEERVMRCTLQEWALPRAVIAEESHKKRNRETNYEVLSVWDLEANAWRSFRIRNVQSFIMVEDNLGYGED